MEPVNTGTWLRPLNRTYLIAWVLLVAAPFGCGKERPRGDTVQAAGRDVLVPGSGGELVLIPAGQFIMGDPDGPPDAPPHEVSARAFYMDRWPVSQALYTRVMGANPSQRKGEDHPVERIRWTDAVTFCNRCSALDGLTPCYDLESWTCDFSADGYRLPTEAEWEYACRAGGQTAYSFGNDASELPEHAWFKSNSGGRPQPVGGKLPNAWGLYDLHGNVWEWCHDFYDETYYRDSPRVDPPGPSSGRQRVLRGGAWNSTADACRAAHRFQEFPVFTDACFGADSYGFRRVRRASRDAPASAEQRRATSAAEKREHRAAAAPAARQAEPEQAHPAAAPLPAADGPIDAARLTGMLVFVSDRSGSLDIWTMRANGTQCRPLTNDEHPDADPRFSPDGQRILYTSLRDGFPELWIMSRDGSAPQRVTDGCQPAWHPDGQSIVFIRDDQAFVRELESGRERRVTPAAWKRCGVPAWSPDGKQIAVASRHLGRIGIFILDVQGRGDPKQLPSEDPCCTPQWSPDGKRMLFQTIKGHIHEMDLDRGTEEPLTFGADVQHDPRYSPDGQMVVFARGPTQQGPWQLGIVDLRSDDLDVVPVTGAGSNRLPDWHRSDRSEHGP